MLLFKHGIFNYKADIFVQLVAIYFLFELPVSTGCAYFYWGISNTLSI